MAAKEAEPVLAAGSGELVARSWNKGTRRSPQTPEPVPVDLEDTYAPLSDVRRGLSHFYAELVNAAADEPIQVPITLPAEPNPVTPESPEAPTLPEPAPDSPEIPESPAPQPEIPDVPVGPEIDPAGPTPEIQPGYSPTPEITDIPPTTLAEIPQSPPSAPASPVGLAHVDASAMVLRFGRSGGMQPSTVLAQAEKMHDAGSHSDAPDLYALALQQGKADVAAVRGASRHWSRCGRAMESGASRAVTITAGPV